MKTVYDETDAVQSLAVGEPSPYVRSQFNLLNELIRFFGSLDSIPRHMFPRHWTSRRAILPRAFYSFRFLFIALRSGKDCIVLHGPALSGRDYEFILADDDVQRRVVRLLFSGKPFLIARTQRPGSALTTCPKLGLETVSEIHGALSINSVNVLFGNMKNQQVVVHLARSAAGSAAIERHRRGLETIAAAPLSPHFRKLVPALVSFDSSVAGYRVLKQTRLPGSYLRLAAASETEFYSALNRALDCILDLRFTAAEYRRGADADLLFDVYPRILAEWSHLRPLLAPMLTRLQIWQRKRRLVPILTHGDCWLRNVLWEETEGAVTGIIDWERSRRYGTPGIDAIHLAFMSLALERHGDIERYFVQAWTDAWESPALAKYVARVKHDFGLDKEDIGCLAAMVCFNELHKLHNDFGVIPDHRTRLLEDLRPAIASWLAQ